MHRSIGAVTLSCVKGDITEQPDIEIIVNAANGALAGGGGVDGAIHRAAGPELVAASRALAPISAGEAVITPAFKLPNAWVVHAVGPVYSAGGDVASRLASCYRQAMRLAEEKQATSIAFPAISAGVYGYPMNEAADIAVETVAASTRDALTLRLVRFVLFSATALDAFAAALSRID